MQEIFDAIKAYAKAYEQLQEIQDKHSDYLPFGDQKTGVIGEFFSMMHAKRRFPEASLCFGPHGWDICVTHSPEAKMLIQVKTVSAYSKTCRVSPIHSGWDELWLMRLDRKLLPEGFWIFEKAAVPWSGGTVKHSTMPRHGKLRTGSKIFSGRQDALADLWLSLKNAHPSLHP